MCLRSVISCLKLDDADEYQSIGIEKLLSYEDDAISLVPADNERHIRRDEETGPTSLN